MWQYGVLVEFSLRYPPVMGRLHTRYAPVRRSPAAYCYALLPLDLHVLGLPLAFILSQDQTLHCKNFSFLPLTRSCPQPRHSKASDTRYLLFQTFQCTVALSHFSTSPFFRRKRVQRYNRFPNWQIFFCFETDFSCYLIVGQRQKN